jgi:hypothetical protein
VAKVVGLPVKLDLAVLAQVWIPLSVAAAAAVAPSGLVQVARLLRGPIQVAVALVPNLLRLAALVFVLLNGVDKPCHLM